MSDQALFVITPGSAAERDRAERVLAEVDCYLAPTATRGTYAVTCSRRDAGQQYDPADAAAAALERAKIMVIER